MKATEPPCARHHTANSVRTVPSRLAGNNAGQDAPHAISLLSLNFSNEDVAEIARAAGVPIQHPDLLGSAGVWLKGLADGFAEMSRLQRENPAPNRGRGRPKDLARGTLLRGYANVYWRLTGKRPNFRNTIGERDGESKAILFVREILTRTAEQLERAADPESRNGAQEFRRLLALKNRGLVGRFEEDMAFDAHITRMLYPRALDGAAPQRGRPFRGRG